MKKFHTYLSAALAALAVGGLALSAPVAATTIVATKGFGPNVSSYGVVDVTTNYTNATTSASDVTGLTVTVPKTIYGVLGNQFYRACVYADAGKATATSGTLTINVNGSDVTASAKQVQSAAGRSTVSFCHVGARPTLNSFIVKVRGVSADTNVFTVYAGSQLTVETLTIPQ